MDDEFCDQEFSGNDALAQMVERLSGTPRAIELAERVVNYFGDTLVLILRPWEEVSCFGIRQDDNRVDIKLATNNDWVAAALSHELLHVALLMDGYPWTFCGYTHWYLNHLHHDIMFEPFLALGFAAKQFVGPAEVRDYESMDNARKITSDQWCGEYYSHWATWRHLGTDNNKGCMDEIIRCGSMKFPELPKALDRIHSWHEHGEFRQPDQFVSSLKDLAAIMGDDTAMEFYLVQGGI